MMTIIFSKSCFLFMREPWAINKDSLPGNLPGDDSLALVILGQGLNADGSMKDELIRRLKVGLDCSEQYPNAYVV